MISKNTSRSELDIKSSSVKKTKKFNQDYQSEDNLDVLNQYLIDSQIKESLNKQKLYQSKRENEALREQLQELEARKKKLEAARDINQKFFKKNEVEISSLRKPLEDIQYISDSAYHHEPYEALRLKIKTTVSENRQEIDNLLEKQPKYEEILITSDPTLEKILELLRSQILIFKEEMIQKEKSYRNMQDRYQTEFEMLSEQHTGIKGKIDELTQERKDDMLRKYQLERKIAYLEADVELGDGYVNAQKLALMAAQEINQKIKKADHNNQFNSLNSKIQRRLNSTKPI
jgi:chromosome segregation ATPase